MLSSKTIFSTLLLLSVTCTITACAPGTRGGVELDRTNPEPLRSFENEKEFDSYVQDLIREAEFKQSMATENFAYNNAPQSEDVGMASSANNASDKSNEGITNNQEEGVDEGGIVKNIGDYLVILRRGRLYSVSVQDSDQFAQLDDLPVARDSHLNQGVWYDELLVKGDQIYVIGYRYNIPLTTPGNTFNTTGGTEISSFKLDTKTGKFSRGETMFLESNDYFSSSNYASRLVGGKLVFYMPSSGFHWGSNNQMQLHIPSRIAYLGDGKSKREAPLFDWADVVRPFVPPVSPTFHTIVTCELPTSLDFSCTSKTLLGEWSRTFYVSADEVYLWTDSHVFAIPFKGDDIVAHSTIGAPLDQFSFKAEDGKLHVAVANHKILANGDWENHLEMLSLDRAAFDRVGKQSLNASNKTRLIDDHDWSFMKHKHVGEYYIHHKGLWSTDVPTTEIVLFHRKTGAKQVLSVKGRPSRIDGLGQMGAMVAVQEGHKLVFHTLELGANATLKRGEELDHASEGESRSHGFFFKPGETGGRFGISVLQQKIHTFEEEGQEPQTFWWNTGVSNIAFFDVDLTGTISIAGAVSSSPKEDSFCDTSCIDWYGNTRPIFLRDRLIALMGSEMAEISFDGEGMSEEKSRINLEATNFIPEEL